MPTRLAVEIRPVGDADHDAWLPLWQGYQRFYMTEIPAEVIATNWRRFLDPADPLHAALAWADGQAVGLVHWLYHRSSWTIGDYCYLEDLYIARDLRGQGVGRQLIDYVEAAARDSGCSKLYWLTHETNTMAMRLYARVAERSGFVQYAKAL